jgi:hypothetical protein
MTLSSGLWNDIAMESILRKIGKIPHNVGCSRARVKFRLAAEMPMRFYFAVKDRRVLDLEYVSMWAMALLEG